MVILVLLSAVLAPPQADCTPQFAPLHTGSHSASSSLPFWRKEDADAWNGGGWLGWSWNSKALTPVTLVVRDRPKAPPDEGEYVTVEMSTEVTWAVRCIQGLRPGPITPARPGNSELRADRPQRISLGGRNYEVRIRSRRVDLADATVTLTDGRRTQVLYSTDGFVDDPHFEIKWAGDLDGDGRLDLIVNLSRKYSVNPYRLLLSSRASGNLLVGDAAAHEAVAE